MVLASCPPTLEADYHGPGSGPNIGLVPQLVWQAWLSSHLGSHQLTAHHHVQHYAAGSFSGKDCKLLITCLTINKSTCTQTQENMRHRHRCLASYSDIQSSLFRCDQNFQHRHEYSQKLFMHINTCPHTEDCLWTCPKGVYLISV